MGDICVINYLEFVDESPFRSEIFDNLFMRFLSNNKFRSIVFIRARMFLGLGRSRIRFGSELLEQIQGRRNCYVFSNRMIDRLETLCFHGWLDLGFFGKRSH